MPLLMRCHYNHHHHTSITVITTIIIVVIIIIIFAVVHPLTKSHICHLGVIFFLCGPNEKTKIVSKALIDCATQQRVSKF